MSDSVTVQLREVLEDYSVEVKRVANNAVDEVAKESVQKLKNTSPKKSGSYSRGWKVKRARGASGIHSNTVYNATDGQLTHLLERGHVIRNKKGDYGRAPAHPHIAPVAEWAESELPKKIEEELQ